MDKKFFQFLQFFKTLGLNANNTVTTFSEFFDDLCNDLDDEDSFYELTKQFVALKTDVERMRYVWKIPKLQNILFLTQRKVDKSAEFALAYSDGTYFPTEYGYPGQCGANATLLAAPYPYKNNGANADTLVKAYAARAELLSRIERFDDGLKDIERGLSFECSPEARCYLLERLGKIYEHTDQLEKAIGAYTTARDICNKTNNKEMRDVYDEMINTVKRILKKGGKKPLSSRKTKAKIKADLPKTPRHVCEKLSIDIEHANPKVPFASSAVEIRDGGSSGNTLVAVRDIKPGELIISEPPYAYGMVSKVWTFTYCHHCLRRTDNPIPCFTCYDAGFCNEECRDAGWQTMHSDECQLFRYLAYNEEALDEIVISLRIILKAGCKTLYELYKEVCNGKNLLDLNPETYNAIAYLTVYNLPCEEAFALNQFRNSVYAYLCLQLLDKYTKFFLPQNPDDALKYSSAEFKIFISSLLLRHLSNAGYKSLVIDESIVLDKKWKPTMDAKFTDKTFVESKIVGRGMCPLIALCNHSCDPNTLVAFRGKIAIMRSVRSIAKGEEITCEQIPGCNFMYTEKQERQELIFQRFKKKCECAACRDDYPTHKSQLEMLDGINNMNCRRKLFSQIPIAKFNLKPGARLSDLQSLYDANQTMVDELMKRQQEACSCPEVLDMAVSYMEALEKFCSRPSFIFHFIDQCMLRIYCLQGNCHIRTKHMTMNYFH